MFTVKKRKKTTYLLLELLLGLTLVTLCLAPLLRIPQQSYSKQKKELALLHFAFERENITCKLEELLRSNQISWSTLYESREKKIFLYEEKFPPFTYKIYLSKGNTFSSDVEGNLLGKITFSLHVYMPPKKKMIQQYHPTFFVMRKKASTAEQKNTHET